MLVTQEKLYPSIFIKEAVDLTLTIEPDEKGVVGAIGALTIGNPHVARVLTGASEPLKSTNVNNGGSLSNEFAYHVSEFYNGFNGKMLVGRLLGADSTTKVIEVTKPVTEYVIDDTTPINIFGVTNIVDWQDTAVAELMEIVVNACPSEKVTISINNDAGLVTVKLVNQYGNDIYSVTGGASFDSLDDNGNNNYIGNVVDTNIMTIKMNTAHANYVATFSVTKEYPNGLVTEAGAINYTSALDALSAVIESCDYAITGGLSDVATVQALRNITFGAKIPFAVDIVGATVADAITYKSSLGIDVSDVYFIWNRSKNKFGAGELNIGLSGFIIGRSVARNLSRLVRNVEYRVSGIAGVDYPVPRIVSTTLPKLSDDDKTLLTKNRINTVEFTDDKLVISDVLSGNAKNVSLRLFPVSEGNLFIQREIAKILKSQLFKNLGLAKSYVTKETNVLFERCLQNSYFDSDAETPYAISITDHSGDTINVAYQYVPEGLLRRGVVEGTLTQKIN